MKIRVFDSGGESFDRYAVFIDVSVYGMSHNPESPQGFNQYCCPISDISNDDNYAHLGEEISFNKLPKEVQNAIKNRME